MFSPIKNFQNHPIISLSQLHTFFWKSMEFTYYCQFGHFCRTVQWAMRKLQRATSKENWVSFHQLQIIYIILDSRPFSSPMFESQLTSSWTVHVYVVTAIVSLQVLGEGWGNLFYSSPLSICFYNPSCPLLRWIPNLAMEPVGFISFKVNPVVGFCVKHYLL